MQIRTISFFVATLLYLTNFASAADEPVEKALSDLAQAANAAQAREIVFSEQRHFPFRKRPIKLSGIARVSQTFGISIYYPDERKSIIINEDSVLARETNSNGKNRERNLSKENKELPLLLNALFTFDLPYLKTAFDISLVDDSETAKLQLIPKQKSDAKIESIAIDFDGNRVLGFAISFVGNRRIEIAPESEKELSSFSDEVLAEFFNRK